MAKIISIKWVFCGFRPSIFGFSACIFWFSHTKNVYFSSSRARGWGGKSLLENGRRHKKDEIKRTKKRKINELGQLSIMTKMHFWVVVGHLWLFALGIFASARRVGLSPLHLSKVPYLTQVSKMQPPRLSKMTGLYHMFIFWACWYTSGERDVLVLFPEKGGGFMLNDLLCARWTTVDFSRESLRHFSSRSAYPQFERCQTRKPTLQDHLWNIYVVDYSLHGFSWGCRRPVRRGKASLPGATTDETPS